MKLRIPLTKYEAENLRKDKSMPPLFKDKDSVG
jgi:hypothetical protein